MTAAEVVKKPAAAKPVKEKKAAKAAPKEKKAKTEKSAKTASHPPYFEMIKEALSALNEKSGSSPYAIAKYMEEKHKSVLPANFRKILGLQLKNSAAKGKLNKIKASYKLSDAGKKEKAAAAKKPAVAAAKKPRAAKAAAPTAAAGTKRKAEAVKKVAVKKGAKKVAVKKGAKKVATPVKAKQPKSIKSPAAKRARRAVAV
ncbi:histone H1 [Salvia miltiorrhiza]|uniref:histone H1 n=1 Tax=Salvia miltiorrhiza TaxID=226208 RepID=UPI0025ABC61A|nr:histone H1 [Salvia miltiorrhiza]